MSRMLLASLIAFLALALVSPEEALAQFDSAFEGTVTDVTGAVVPGAGVTITNEDQGVTRMAGTNASGYFRMADLAPGNYRIEVQLEGFNTWVQTGVILDARQVRTIAPTLEVGEVATEVTIEATISSVNTANAQTSVELDEEMIEDAPLPGRAVWRQAAIVPGVVGTGLTGGSQSASRTAGGEVDNFEPQLGLRVMAAGQRQDSNQFVLDGSYINENSRAGSAFVSPFPDTVESFNVRANEFSADKGLSSGVFIEVVSKAGTNDYHGSLAWWHTNNRMRARSIVDKELPVFRRNESWGTLGGPIVRNKTFFFVGLDVLRSSQTQSAVGTVETPEFVSFVKSRFADSLAGEIFDLQAPANPPTANIQTIGEIKASLPGQFPDGMFPDDLPAVGTTFVTSSSPRNGEQLTLRGDHHFNDVKDRLFGYYYRSTSDTRGNDSGFIRPGITRPNTSLNYFIKAQWTHIFSPTVLNHLFLRKRQEGRRGPVLARRQRKGSLDLGRWTDPSRPLGSGRVERPDDGMAGCHRDQSREPQPSVRLRAPSRSGPYALGEHQHRAAVLLQQHPGLRPGPAVPPARAGNEPADWRSKGIVHKGRLELQLPVHPG